METFLKGITFYLIMLASPGLKHFEVNEFLSLKPIGVGSFLNQLYIYIYIYIYIYMHIYFSPSTHSFGVQQNMIITYQSRIQVGGRARGVILDHFLEFLNFRHNNQILITYFTFGMAFFSFQHTNLVYFFSRYIHSPFLKKLKKII